MKKPKKQLQQGFPKGTKVLCAWKGYLPIEEIKVGDLVLSHNSSEDRTNASFVLEIHKDEVEVHNFYRQQIEFRCAWDQHFYGYNNICTGGGIWTKHWGFLSADDFNRFTYLQLVSPYHKTDSQLYLDQIGIRNEIVPSQYFYQVRYDNKIDRVKYFSEMQKEKYERCAIICQLAGDKAFYRSKGGSNPQRPYCFFEKQFMRLDNFRVQSKGIDEVYSLTTELGTYIIQQNGFYSIVGGHREQ